MVWKSGRGRVFADSNATYAAATIDELEGLS